MCPSGVLLSSADLERFGQDLTLSCTVVVHGDENLHVAQTNENTLAANLAVSHLICEVSEILIIWE